MEGIEIEPRRNRRTGGERQDDAAEHETEHGRQHRAVHRPPPFAEGCAYRARNHGCSSSALLLPRHGFQAVNAGGFLRNSRTFGGYLAGTIPGKDATSSRKRSPRTSKFRNWSNEAQA